MIGIDIKLMGMNTESCSDVNGTQEFKCQCKGGLGGQRCEAAVCSSDYCNNNGLCQIKYDNENDIEQLQCECFDGFGGQRCEKDLCDDVICQNGFCDSGRCICNAGYINIDDICEETCDLNPCEELIETSDNILSLLNCIIRYSSILNQDFY